MTKQLHFLFFYVLLLCLPRVAWAQEPVVPDSALFVEENGSTHLHVLLDPTRGIVTDVVVKVLATDGERAAVDADNIQAGTAVVVSHSEDAAESNT